MGNTKNVKREQEFEREQEGLYGRVLRGKREGRKVIIIISK